MFEWDREKIASLLEARATEGQTLEFKAALPSSSDRDKAEFLKDVSAMANAAGGAILYGISERASAADAASGLRFTDADAEIRRLSQVVQSGVEPRIAGIRFSTITLEDGDVLAVDVPQSFDAPHRYLFSGHSKFVQRVGTHVSELTYDQLRAAFDRSNQRLASIRQEWLADFGLTRLWRALPQRPICVIRLSSLLSADGRQTVDPQDAMSRWSDLIQSSWYGGSPSYNYEGLVVAPSRDDTLESFVQVHRVGAITAYQTVGIEWHGEDLFVPARAESFVMEALPKAVNFLRNHGIAGAALVHIGIRGLSGYKFVYTASGFEQKSTGRLDDLQLPEILIEDLTDDLDRHAVLRPGFDLVWQSYGQANCRHYRPDGIWEVK